MYILSRGVISVWVSPIRDWQKPKSKCANFRFVDQRKLLIGRFTYVKSLQFVELVQNSDLVVRIGLI